MANDIDEESLKLKKQEEELLANIPEDLPESSKQILKSFVSVHNTFAEKKRAYDLAVWILDRKG